MAHLAIIVVTLKNTEGTTTSSSTGELILPPDLPSIEDALLKLAAVMKALENPKLSKTVVMRLRTRFKLVSFSRKNSQSILGTRK